MKTMNKITCITVDDDPFVLMVLKDLISSDERLELIDECEDSISATLSISKGKPSILFLDVMLPGLNGLEVLDILDEKPIIIIISGIKNIKEQTTLQNNPYIADYLSKPIELEPFKSAVNLAIEKMSEKTK